MMFLLDSDHISILQKQSGPEYAELMGHQCFCRFRWSGSPTSANWNDGSADSIDRVESGIDVADTQLAPFQQGSRPGHRGLDDLINLK